MVHNECADETDAPGRGTGPGGCLELQEESRVVKVDWDRQNILQGPRYDGTHPRSDGSERVDGANALCQENQPGGQTGEQGGPGDVEGDQECQSDGDSVETDGNGCRTEDATSSACSNLIRVNMSLLAADKTGQHGQRKRTTMDIPESSKPPPIDHRPSTDQQNPPHRHG